MTQGDGVNMMKSAFVVGIIFLLLPLAGCQEKQIVGNDLDAHGCKGSAGYSWCEAKQKCLRAWEEECAGQPVNETFDLTVEECEQQGGRVAEATQSACTAEETNAGSIATDSVCCLPAGVKLTEDDAYAIAEDSECIGVGPLSDTAMYNENTKTWWIDLEAEKQGCNPACVVSESTQTAEVNWRCTGLVEP